MGRSRFIDRCRATGIPWTRQRRVIAEVLAEASDHPDVSELHKRVAQRAPGISTDTIYRMLRLLQHAGLLESRVFRDRRRHYEKTVGRDHDHLIDLDTGAIVEFRSVALDRLRQRMAERLGYRLLSYRLELYGRRLTQRATTRRQRKALRRPFRVARPA